MVLAVQWLAYKILHTFKADEGSYYFEKQHLF